MGKADSILRGTALLTGAGFIVKLIGAAYRIPLSRLIGSEGMGLYQMAYPVYLMFLSLSTAGIPIAISKIIAEQSAKGNAYGVKKVFQGALILLLILGAGGSIGMAFAAPWLAAKVVVDPRAVYAMWALAPAIFFMSIIAAFRGFFQGQQLMSPSAGSQVIEQVIRVSVALILVFLLMKYGIEHAAAGAAFGATAGGAAALIFLISVYWRRRHLCPKPTHNPAQENLIRIMKRLIKFALPISLAVILMPVLQTIDSVIVPARLQSIGYTVKQATSMLGILGNSWAVMYLPMIVTAAISSNMVPAIAASAVCNLNSASVIKIQAGLRMAILYLIPVSVILYLFGGRVYQIIYGTAGIDILSWLAPAVVFLGLEQVSAGILQGLGRPNLPLVNFVSGAFLKIMVTLITTGLPGLNLAGAALGTVSGACLTAILNITAVKRLTRVKFAFLTAPLVAGLILLISGWYLRRQIVLGYLVELILVGLIGMIIYLGTLWLLGGIGSKDLEVVRKFYEQRRTDHGDGDTAKIG